MLVAELIERKRDGEELSAAELDEFLAGYLSGDIAEYQMASFLMAVFFRGLSATELTALTRAIIGSGARLDFDDGGPPAVDKHSTGGVGDKVSLILAPLVAEAGLRVPMMSGRGLGHTGGTLDKLESIPGFQTRIDLEEFRAVLADVGCAMIGQTPEIAPLDGRLYALRDVSGTVQSIPLIASSIISKKVAEGISALVLDVKCGRGAFMQSREDAEALARVMVGLAAAEGLRATALLTAMDEPLGEAVGHSLEVREALDALADGGPADLREVTLALSAELLVSAGIADTTPAARRALEDILASGRAAQRFARLVERQGGDPGIVEDPSSLPSAPVQAVYEAPRSGRVARVDARRIGLTALELGAGRRRVEDSVDLAVGFIVETRVGAIVEGGEPLVAIHARDEAGARRAVERLQDAIQITDAAPDEGLERPLILGRITAD
jgi:pyrimidine-nucleoside phosphorylase